MYNNNNNNYNNNYQHQQQQLQPSYYDTISNSIEDYTNPFGPISYQGTFNGINLSNESSQLENTDMPNSSTSTVLEKSKDSKKKQTYQHWNQGELQKYEQFLKDNYTNDLLHDDKKRKSQKIFVQMSLFIGTKNNTQCKSKHQKQLQKGIMKRIEQQIILESQQQQQQPPSSQALFIDQTSNIRISNCSLNNNKSSGFNFNNSQICLQFQPSQFERNQNQLNLNINNLINIVFNYNNNPILLLQNLANVNLDDRNNDINIQQQINQGYNLDPEMIDRQDNNLFSDNNLYSDNNEDNSFYPSNLTGLRYNDQDQQIPCEYSPSQIRSFSSGKKFSSNKASNKNSTPKFQTKKKSISKKRKQERNLNRV